jgi:Arc/MetJ-type ribon-helix-helix transcriptional regulator
MAKVTIDISDTAKEFMDREIASGRFKDTNALMQVALDHLMRTKWKENADLKINEALDEYQRGEFTPWQDGDCEKWGANTSSKNVRVRRRHDRNRPCVVIVA